MAALTHVPAARRPSRLAGLFALCMLAVLGLASPASAHTRMLSSTPAADTVLRPGVHIPVRLVFSEPIEASLATITITGPDGVARQLRVRADARDVHAVLSDWLSGGAGKYSVVWHVVSADGHPVDGTFAFTVEGDTATADSAAAPVLTSPVSDATVDSARDAAQVEHERLEAWPEVPVLPAVLRAAAAFFILATAGLLAFVGWRTDEERRRGTHGLLTWLAAGAFLLSAAHALAWSFYATGDAPGSSLRALGTAAARAEIARVVLTLLALACVVITRRVAWATAFAWLALFATVAIGHAAAIHPLLLLPLKAIHLAAAAMWLGGLLVLLRRTPPNVEATVIAETALRVSTVALIGVVLLAASGVAQSLVLLTPGQILTTKYGVLSLAKAGVLVVLIGMGAINKFRNLPAVLRGEAVDRLRRTVVLEVVVIVLAFLLAGALAYTSPPERPAAPDSLQSMVMP
jgi:copper transport protein